MRVYLILIISILSFSTYSQEKTIKSISIEWEKLGAPLSLINKEIVNNKYQLMEVDLSIDLRKQYLKKNSTSSFMMLPENKFIQSEYNVAIPQSNQRNVGFTISGYGYNGNRNTGGIKNNAYKDASLYSGAYCPITGLAY